MKNIITTTKTHLNKILKGCGYVLTPIALTESMESCYITDGSRYYYALLNGTFRCEATALWFMWAKKSGIRQDKYNLLFPKTASGFFILTLTEVNKNDL